MKKRPESGSVEDLAARIRHHRALYYAGQPEISDAEFDWLEDRLRALAPDHPVLAEIGAPPRDEAEERVAEAEAADLAAHEEAGHLASRLRVLVDAAYDGKPFDPKSYKRIWLALEQLDAAHPLLAWAVPPEGRVWPKARHELPMGSLNKVNTPAELSAWALRCDELSQQSNLSPVSPDLFVTEKLDGLSLEVVYENGRMERAITRGDGAFGEDLTPNVARMQGVPATIPMRGRISVRGEIILRRSNAGPLAALRLAVNPKSREGTSLRNSAAGAARNKDPRLLAACRLLTVIFYDLEGVEGLSTEREKLTLLEAQGFSVASATYGGLDEAVTLYRRYESELRASLDHDIDGLVVRANNLRSASLLGELNNRPRAAVAFKFGQEQEVTKLLEILWSTGDSGRITPIAQVEPVFLAGATVRQASLHNLAKVRAMGIGAGDQVLVSRRGDVIPYVEKVVIKGPHREEAPERCHDCKTPVALEGEYLICRNELCPARVKGRMKTWIGQLGLLGWGEETIERLYQEGLARTVPELYRLTEAQVSTLKGFGVLSASKLLEPLQARKELPLPIFIAALGIEQISKETAKLLVSAGYDTVDKFASASPEALAAIPGIGAIKAERILSGIRARLPEIAELETLGVRPVRPSEGGPLAGLSFCFSGASSRPRKVLEGWVEKHGGQVSASVNKGLKYLVLADASSTSSKAEKARKLGTQIIDEAGFMALLEARGAAVE